VAVDSLSNSQARRIALAAQGFTDRRPAKVDLRAVSRVLDRVALLQIDSVNVVTRAQYMPLFSRLGPYDVEVLHRAASRRPRRVFEYWGHEASYIRTDLYPALRFRMKAAEGVWRSVRRLSEEKPEFIQWVLEEVTDRGPLTAREIEHDVPRTKDHWGWNWSEVKIALEWLFYTGQVTAARRNTQFERVYDLPERVLPPEVVRASALSPEDAHRSLMRASAKAHGVGTLQCLRDYFRMSPAPARRAIEELVESGELLPVSIEGWRRPGFVWHEAKIPRRVDARALLSPFDSLIFERTRTEQLFGYRYRIEIYVPAHLRIYGYYVYSFLLGDRIAARVDLKADRQANVLRVQSAHLEPGAPEHTASALRQELKSMAGWLGLSGITVAPQGDLAPALG
jgi:uncharacterized protein YcaQ